MMPEDLPDPVLRNVTKISEVHVRYTQNCHCSLIAYMQNQTMYFKLIFSNTCISVRVIAYN